MRWMSAALITLALSACETAPPECTAGAESCPCESGSVCDEGLVCMEGICEAPRELTLSVGDPAARACEVLLRDGDAEVASVRFYGPSGAHVREAPLTSLSFAAASDAPIGASVSLQVLGEGAPTVERARCFDAEGRELAGAQVQVGS